MIDDKKIIGLIPARMKSTRLPGKPLREILGLPMIIHVMKRVMLCDGLDDVFVATDSPEIYDAVVKYGGKAIMTSENHSTGTDRLSEVAKKIEADIYINIQGDEPTLDPSSIQKVIDAKLESPVEIINAMSELSSLEDPANVNIPKVVFNESAQMVYMSRAAIPGFKDEKAKPKKYYKQVCIYAFNREELISFGSFGRKGTLESHEDIEILRFLDLGKSIRMVEVPGNTFAVDVKEDIPIVEKRLKEIHNLL